MKKFRIVSEENGKFILDTGGVNPAICYIWDLNFPESGNNLNLQVDWVVNSRYSKGRRKKMLKKTINSFLRRIIQDYKHILKKD
jgi:hypothetical protein